MVLNSARGTVIAVKKYFTKVRFDSIQGGDMSKNSNKLLIGAAAGAGLLAMAALRNRAKNRYSLEGKVVLITGGSRGLGLVMAREFASRGAKVAISARIQDELDRAKADRGLHPDDIFAVKCDMRRQDEVKKLVSDVRARFGKIDVLVNNAGVIQVGPLAEQTQEDFEDAMAIHFWAPYYAMQEVIPHMRRRGEGRIVNIISIGGKIAVPHLAAYCASKFALAGLSSAMQVELAKHGVYVTSVYPGLMRTGSHINAYFKGQNREEFTMFSLMGSLPVTSISAESAARQIVSAMRRGDRELVISPQAKIAAKVHALFPELTTAILSLTDRVLPGPGGIGTEMERGLNSTTPLAPSFLTSLNDRASYRNNELRPNEQIA